MFFLLAEYASSHHDSYDSYNNQSSRMVSENKSVMMNDSTAMMMQNEHISHDFSGPELTSTPEPAEAIVEQERINDDGKIP